MRDRGKRCREGVHQEARIDPGTHDGALGAAGKDVESRRDLGVSSLRERELLASRNNMQVLSQRLLDLRRDLFQVRAGAMEQNATVGTRVDPSRRHRLPDRDVGRAVDERRQRPSHHLGIDFDRADHLEEGVVQRRFGNSQPDRAKPLDDDR
ncbi:MAG: hypothetical protein F4177_03895 [Chloroflexi bacterium]|nr:hypothetical protein [Chloroflexota bacterium]